MPLPRTAPDCTDNAPSRQFAGEESRRRARGRENRGSVSSVAQTFRDGRFNFVTREMSGQRFLGQREFYGITAPDTAWRFLVGMAERWGASPRFRDLTLLRKCSSVLVFGLLCRTCPALTFTRRGLFFQCPSWTFSSERIQNGTNRPSFPQRRVCPRFAHPSLAEISTTTPREAGEGHAGRADILLVRKPV
jgi:hypothetical protein